MSRRDTIIIAVLVNAGLLLVLFVTAMRSGKEPEMTPKLAEAAPIQENRISQGEELATTQQPLDSLLSQYAAIPTLSDGPAEEILFPTDLPATIITEEIPQVEAKPALASSSASPAVVSSESSIASVTVKKGDVLEKIARTHGTSVNAIMKANNLSSTQLKIGQVLKVPSKEGVQKKESSSSSSGEYYVVKEGDSPWLIASKNNVKLEELLRINNLDEQKARKLRPGDRLRIR